MIEHTKKIPLLSFIKCKVNVCNEVSRTRKTTISIQMTVTFETLLDSVAQVMLTIVFYNNRTLRRPSRRAKTPKQVALHHSLSHGRLATILLLYRISKMEHVDDIPHLRNYFFFERDFPGSFSGWFRIIF